MSTKSKKKTAKKAAAMEAPGKPQAAPKLEPGAKPIIRAIRVTQVILDAAKAYKKATGTSFYTLGHDTIRERLVKEGYLKATEAGASA
jgi:hypothetical protein